MLKDDKTAAVFFFYRLVMRAAEVGDGRGDGEVL